MDRYMGLPLMHPKPAPQYSHSISSSCGPRPCSSPAPALLQLHHGVRDGVRCGDRADQGPGGHRGRPPARHPDLRHHAGHAAPFPALCALNSATAQPECYYVQSCGEPQKAQCVEIFSSYARQHALILSTKCWSPLLQSLEELRTSQIVSSLGISGRSGALRRLCAHGHPRHSRSPPHSQLAHHAGTCHCNELQ